MEVPRAPSPPLYNSGLFGPRAGSESFQLGATTQRNRNPEGGHRPSRECIDHRQGGGGGPAAGGGPVGSFCSTEEGGHSDGWWRDFIH